MSRSCYSAAERQVVEEYPKAARPQPDRRVTIHRIKRALHYVELVDAKAAREYWSIKPIRSIDRKIVAIA
jgi:hypothetical protein